MVDLLQNEFKKKTIAESFDTQSETYTDGERIDSFYQQLSIRIEQPVNAMSISPSKRDIVLAGRNGLLIIDLENPFDQPRSLPYNSRWEVSEVQWNPHTSKDTWIASTNNQEGLIWNLNNPKLKTIEYVLSGHERAISDINWSNFHPSVLGTASLDTSIKVWDLRQNTSKCSLTLKNWNLAISQIDFHPTHEFLIATAQESELKVWDMRRGSDPLHSIMAHDRKIANINWDPKSENELLTCSYDKTIKFWNLNDLSTYQSKINTNFPIGRARYTPFGNGVISIPLRSETSLYLWDKSDPKPVFKYKGHTGIVKEFLWRIHGKNDDSESDQREFQLVTFSLDRQLRLWPIGESQLKSVGHSQCRINQTEIRQLPADNFTYRKPRYDPCTLPVPIPSNIKPNNRTTTSVNDFLDCIGSPPNDDIGFAKTHSALHLVPSLSTAQEDYHFMKPKASPSWAVNEPSLPSNPSRDLATATELPKEWAPNNLADEFGLITKHFKRIKLEKVNVPERFCTLTLHGPWAIDGTPAFLRVNIRFPNHYPNKEPPHFDILKSGMIPMATRSAIANTLYRIAFNHTQNNQYCLQACINYLLGEKVYDSTVGTESVLSDEDFNESKPDPKYQFKPNSRDLMYSAERDDYNVPFPRMCGGVFGPYGQLLLFYSALNSPANVETPGKLQGVLHQAHPRSYESLDLFKTMSRLPSRIILNRRLDDLSPASEDNEDLDDLLTIPSLFYRPNTQRLPNKPDPATDPIFIATPVSLESSTLPLVNETGNMIYFHAVPGTVVPDLNLARDYRLLDAPLPDILTHNRKIAKLHGRRDLAKLWKLLHALLVLQVPEKLIPNDLKYEVPLSPMVWGIHPFGRKIAQSLIHHFEKLNDVQTLAMLACVFDLAKKFEPTYSQDSMFKIQPSSDTLNYNLGYESPKDYFSSGFFRKNSKVSALSSGTNTHTGYKSPLMLMNPLTRTLWGNMTHLQPNLLQPQLGTKANTKSLAIDANATIASPPLKTAPLPIGNFGFATTPPINNSVGSVTKKDSNSKSLPYELPTHHLVQSLPDPSIKTPELKTIDPSGSLMVQDTLDFVEDGFEGPNSYSTTHSKEPSLHTFAPLFKPLQVELRETKALPNNTNFSASEESRLTRYRYLYSEILFRWQLFIPRTEILAFLPPTLQSQLTQTLSYESICIKCSTNNSTVTTFNGGYCTQCDNQRKLPKCSLCNTLVKGQATFCPKCNHGGHTNHIKVYFLKSKTCPAGCGCNCFG